MNYLIIEDEIHNAQLLNKYVQQIKADASLLAIIPSVAEAVEWFEHNAMPDIIFMDIRLEDGLSFELFNQVKFSCPIVFTTAYDEYALQAFKVYGTAYLLKPIMKGELSDVIDKFYTQSLQQNKVDLKELISSFLPEKKNYKQQFLIHFKDQLLSISVKEIDYVFLEHKVTYLKLLSGVVYAVAYTLDEMEEHLDPKEFFRANRQYIISRHSIGSIFKHFNEKAKVLLKSGKDAELIISRLRLPFFKEWLDS